MKQTKEKPASTAKAKTIYAKDFWCTRCIPKITKKEVHRAVTFVGLNDPDGTRYPMCRKHADEWRLEFFLAISYDDLKPGIKNVCEIVKAVQDENVKRAACPLAATPTPSGGTAERLK